MISYGDWAPAAKSDGAAYDAVDGDLFTLWSTGKPQRGDEWFIIDMGEVHAIASIELENSWAPYDYPREYRVSLSDDGERWTTPVAEGIGTQSITTIECDVRKGRYVKLEQRGHHEKYWWSISDIRIYAADSLFNEQRLYDNGKNSK